METSPTIIFNNFKRYLFNREDVISPSQLINELFEFILVVLLYPIISFLNLMVQFFKFFYQLTLSASRSQTSPPPSTTLVPNSILITGASSGIGLSLAKTICNQWLIQNRIKLGQNSSSERKLLTLVSRHSNDLERAREEIYQTFSSRNLLDLVDIQVRTCNGRDRIKMEKIVTEVDYDMIVANAGTNSQLLSREHQQEDEKGEQHVVHNLEEEDIIYEEFQVNMIGMLNTVLPAMKQAKKRCQDLSQPPKHVVVISSGVAHHGKIMGPYGLTKSFLFDFSRLFQFIISSNEVVENSLVSSELMGMEMKKYANSKQLVLHVVNPAGVTDTRAGQTVKNIDMIPGSINSNRAASLILNGLMNNERIIDLNNSFVYAGLRFLNALPISAENFLTKCLNLQMYS